MGSTCSLLQRWDMVDYASKSPSRLMSIPNYLTFFRIFISPIFPVIYIKYEYFGISPIMSCAMPFRVSNLLPSEKKETNPTFAGEFLSGIGETLTFA